jgi:hypothetical protein
MKGGADDIHSHDHPQRISRPAGLFFCSLVSMFIFFGDVEIGVCTSPSEEWGINNVKSIHVTREILEEYTIHMRGWGFGLGLGLTWGWVLWIVPEFKMYDTQKATRKKQTVEEQCIWTEETLRIHDEVKPGVAKMDTDEYRFTDKAADLSGSTCCVL